MMVGRRETGDRVFKYNLLELLVIGLFEAFSVCTKLVMIE